MENKSLSLLIAAFVMIIIGVSLIGTTATQVLGKTATTAVTAEAHALDLGAYPAINTTKVYTVTYAPSGWELTDCPLTSFAVKNSSGSALTLTSDYTVNLTDGTYKLLNTVNTNTTLGLYPVNNTYAYYNYCGDEYLNSDWGRTVLNLVPGFFGIAILLIAIGLFYKIAKEEGILG